MNIASCRSWLNVHSNVHLTLLTSFLASFKRYVVYMTNTLLIHYISHVKMQLNDAMKSIDLVSGTYNYSLADTNRYCQNNIDTDTGIGISIGTSLQKSNCA